MRFILAALIIGSSGLAWAQDVRDHEPRCRNESQADKNLSDHHDELPAMILLSRHGYLLKIYLDPTDKSWTIIRVLPNRCAFSLDDGFYFDMLPDLIGPGL